MVPGHVCMFPSQLRTKSLFLPKAKRNRRGKTSTKAAALKGANPDADKGRLKALILSRLEGPFDGGRDVTIDLAANRHLRLHDRHHWETGQPARGAMGERVTESLGNRPSRHIHVEGPCQCDTGC